MEKVITIRQLQEIYLEMLSEFHEFCVANNLTYYMVDGTLLGAVREQGFIPWDDDVDIEMLREDYLRFEKIFKEDEDYVLQTYKNDPYYMQPYAKVRDKHSVVIESYLSKSYKYQGVFVDIFPIESTHKFMNVVTFIPIWLNIKYFAHGMKSKLGRFFIKALKWFSFCLVYITRAIMWLIPGKKLRHTYGAWCYHVERYDKELFPLTTIEFEGYHFPVPRDTEAYLHRLYGDYMKIPDVKATHMQQVEFLK